MSEVKVNKISPRTNCGTVQLGDSGDTITIPSGATITNNGTQTGFGRTGTVDWDTTPKTATFSAVSGDGFFCNTTSSAFTCNLPAGSAGAIVSLADYAGTWQTNSLTVSPNGTNKIGSVNADVTLNTEGQSVTFLYVDDIQGWVNTMDSTSNVRGNPFIEATGGTVTCSGNFKIHTFTGPGTFTVTNAGTPAGSNTVDYLVLAGGAGGWGGPAAGAHGGGGAGGYRESSGAASGCYTASPLGACVSALPVSATAFPITVGGGGAGNSSGSNGSNGSNSVFSTITSTGGGAGDRQNGGSGGGAGFSPTTGGLGNTPPVSPPQGNNGGDGTLIGGGETASGGGGGAGGAGTSGPPSPTNDRGGLGGIGIATSITGSSVTRAGGGNGKGETGSSGTFNPSPSPGGGGYGNGGSATANLGAGGAAGSPSSGAGSGGTVIIRYKFQ